jgi:hypothetical protein
VELGIECFCAHEAVGTRDKAWVFLEYQTMPSLRDVAHDDVLCTLSNRSAPDRGKWCGLSGQAAWTAHRVQNHTLMGHSPPGSHGGPPC